MAYDLDFQEEGDFLLHIKKFFLHPDSWIDPNNQLPINLTWKKTKFTKLNRSKVPLKSGIYAFVLAPEYKNLFQTSYLFYAGKTNRTLSDRFGEYLREKEGKGKPRKKVFKMLNQYEGYLYFFYSEIQNAVNVDNCEKCILDTFVPHINVQIARAKIKPELQYIYEGN